MSVLSRNELRIVLCPRHAALLAIEHRFTRRGIRHELKRKEIVSGTVASAAAGRANPAARHYDFVIGALEDALPIYAAEKPSATLVLSNHFVRYMLVPWTDNLAGEAERTAYAQHCFRELYGERANRWEFRVSPDRDGVPQLSCAVDRRLLTAVRATFGRIGISIASIQPRLMAAYNAAYPRLQKCSAWLGLVEPGMLCLALLQKGQWTRVRSMRVGAQWQEELPRLLEREACFAGTAAEAAREVLLMAPEAGDLMFPDDGRWQFRRLNPADGPARLLEGEWGFAMEGQG